MGMLKMGSYVVIATVCGRMDTARFECSCLRNAVDGYIEYLGALLILAGVGMEWKTRANGIRNDRLLKPRRPEMPVTGYKVPVDLSSSWC